MSSNPASLPCRQGHAFEARLYAESPERGFLPAPGTLRRWRTPPDAATFCWDADTRIDSGVQEGDEVRSHGRGHALTQGVLM